MENYIIERTRMYMKEFGLDFASANDAARKDAALAFGKTTRSPKTGTGAKAPEAKVTYTKVDGTSVECTAAQAAAYEARKTLTDEEREAKPQTRREAIAAWKAEKGIEEIPADAAKAYKALYDANWAKDWAAWADSDERKAMGKRERKDANVAKAKAIRNGYRAQAGMPASSFEK